MTHSGLQALNNSPSEASHVTRSHLLFAGSIFVLVLALLLGGGARQGRLTDAVLQICSVPVLLYALWNASTVEWLRSQKIPQFFCFAILVVPLLQLIPLPPFLWTKLPFRNLSTEVFDILQTPQAWMPISFNPDKTWLSFLSLLPAVALFLATLQLNSHKRKLLCLLLLAGGAVMAFLGVAQVAQGLSSPFRLFEYTITVDAVGFFANRDHFASFLVVMIVFAATLVVAVTRSEVPEFEVLSSRPSHKVMLTIGCFTLLVLFLSAEILARSRAGLGITIIAIFCVYALVYFGPQSSSGNRSMRIVGAATILALGFSIQYALYRALVRFTVDPLQDERFTFYSKTWEAIKELMPAGGGLGTFMDIYPLFEGPQETVKDMVTNRAHNDILELLLEGGVLSLSLMLVFAGWFLVRTFSVWRTNVSEKYIGDKLIAQAASISILILLLHSLVDYPLRTSCLMVLFAFCCALLVETPQTPEDMMAESMETITKSKLKGQKRLTVEIPKYPSSLRKPPSSEPSEVPAIKKNKSLVPAQKRWGEDVEWPEEWRKKSNNAKEDNSKKEKERDFEEW